jgi:uncharacterized protein YbbC (DUF1343 family)
MAGLHPLLLAASLPGFKDRLPTVIHPVKTGLEVLMETGFAALRGKRVGLITNHTGMSPDGRRTADYLAQAPEVTLAALFSPQHGPAGALEDEDYVPSGYDSGAGVPVYSLFDQRDGQEVLRPSPEMLRGLDALVFDIQDVGARFYTYITTLGYALEEAGRAGIQFVVLDRPNPISGRKLEGPILEPRYFSFIGYAQLPVRHAMTVGELARMFNSENRIHAELLVVGMQGWRREMWYDHTGLPWINPSPNLRTLHAATLYPGSCLLEGARNFSIGRGTDLPFQLLGAPWLDARPLAKSLAAREIAGISFIPRRFRPTWSNCAGLECQGLELLTLEREELDPVGLGIEIISAIQEQHPGVLNLDQLMLLIGDDETDLLLRNGADPRTIVDRWQPGLAAFRKRREKFLLYE